MDFLERYIEIQKARFSDRLTVDVAVEEAALGVAVPWLILQPIVENAILHGVAPKTGAGRVEILGAVRDGVLHLEVTDDGPGVPDNRRVIEGTGLTNNPGAPAEDLRRGRDDEAAQPSIRRNRR